MIYIQQLINKKYKIKNKYKQLLINIYKIMLILVMINNKIHNKMINNFYNNNQMKYLMMMNNKVKYKIK